MDDVKLYSGTQTQLNHLLEITHTFSQDIHMQFGLHKCKTLHIEKGSLKHGNFSLGDEGTIASMGEGEVYKYLGFQQAKQTEHSSIKKALSTQYSTRLANILRSELHAKHTIKAINTYAVPILTYSFGVIHWTQTELLYSYFV